MWNHQQMINTCPHVLIKSESYRHYIHYEAAIHQWRSSWHDKKQTNWGLHNSWDNDQTTRSSSGNLTVCYGKVSLFNG